MKKIAIIGAGPAGIESASILAKDNEVLLFEKSAAVLSNIIDKAYLFPDFSSATEIADNLNSKLINDNITLMLNKEVVDIVKNESEWKVVDKEGKNYFVSAVLITTGYQVFDARRKEELGYGIYKGVVTSIDMERMIRYNQVVNSINEQPKRIVFLQCVGSRDEKSGNRYCSKVCCVTAVKQAIEVRKLLPDAEIYIFYMDLRMWGQHFEELYRESQEKYDIRFVRGRISEASSTFDRKVQIKAEDTLLGVPMRMTADLLVLMVGMEASCGTKELGAKCGINGEYGFIKTAGPHIVDNETSEKGLFVAGSCKRPMSINDVINDARSAACVVSEYLK